MPQAETFHLSLYQSGSSFGLLPRRCQSATDKSANSRQRRVTRRPHDFTQEEGARFEVHYEKVRGVYGEKIKPFEAKMETRDEGTFWTLREIEDVNLARVRAFLDDELTIRDIADETGLSKSTVQRLKKKIEAGLLAVPDLSQASPRHFGQDSYSNSMA